MRGPAGIVCRFLCLGRMLLVRGGGDDGINRNPRCGAGVLSLLLSFARTVFVVYAVCRGIVTP